MRGGALGWQGCKVTVLGCGERLRNHVSAPVGGRGENAVIAQQVGTRRRDQRGETAKQVGRLEQERRAPVAEGPLQTVGEPAIGELGEPLLREGRPGAVSAQVREPLTVVLVQMHGRVQGEALEVCRTLPCPPVVG